VRSILTYSESVVFANIKVRFEHILRISKEPGQEFCCVIADKVLQRIPVGDVLLTVIFKERHIVEDCDLPIVVYEPEMVC